MNIQNSNNLSVLFVSHGGGPMPLLGDESHREMVDTLKLVAAKIKKPSAILVISAHWEEEIATITSGLKPPILYDYYGFPEQAYEIQYPAPGEPKLASEVFELLKENGINAALDEQRGFDHGLYVPLKVMYPDADIPCIQLSLLNNLSPSEHINIGQALSGLQKDGLLIMGSGFSFHNMRAFFGKNTTESINMNESFEKWLIDTCNNQQISETERTRRLEQWENAPYARYCHPREEHLLPVHVCYGAVQQACSEYYEMNILNKKASFFLWESNISCLI